MHRAGLGVGSMSEEITWRIAALCRHDDAVHFFAPNHMERKEEKDVREAAARAICGRCPVQNDCLDHALTYGEPHGIWGGLNELQRRRLLQKRSA